jgi:hypothetical protein
VNLPDLLELMVASFDLRGLLKIESDLYNKTYTKSFGTADGERALSFYPTPDTLLVICGAYQWWQSLLTRSGTQTLVNNTL